MTIDAEDTKFSEERMEKISLGESFRSFREAEELSVTELAQRLEVSRQFLSDVEKGRKFVGIDFIKKFCDELGFGIEPFLRVYLREILSRNGLKYMVLLVKDGKSKSQKTFRKVKLPVEFVRCSSKNVAAKEESKPRK